MRTGKRRSSMKRGRSKTAALRILRRRFKRAKRNRHIPKRAKFKYREGSHASRTMPREIFLVDAKNDSWPHACGGVPFMPHGYTPPRRKRRTTQEYRRSDASPPEAPQSSALQELAAAQTVQTNGNGRTDRDDTHTSPPQHEVAPAASGATPGGPASD